MQTLTTLPILRSAIWLAWASSRPSRFKAFTLAADVGIPAEAFSGGAAMLFPSRDQENALRAVRRAVAAAQKQGFEPRVNDGAIIVLDLKDGGRVVPLCSFG
ncbi:hypothetical protein ACTOWA_00260 [Herbaspirillum seropedicae]|uniref:hypothetical protein n=1 Tax=Herbaspirillum seropedicae TaxID=964 RepID=UPI002855BB95|nr:hypothetical protein [Herbaspirillum seropedicae]MDR6397978.1 hypothetical protein [Herbaspirillum seropedicae]